LVGQGDPLGARTGKDVLVEVYEQSKSDEESVESGEDSEAECNMEQSEPRARDEFGADRPGLTRRDLDKAFGHHRNIAHLQFVAAQANRDHTDRRQYDRQYIDQY
jgi:hypothetical protein